jgi:two-component system, chemotaxis family, chemotaxis protein CheY
MPLKLMTVDDSRTIRRIVTTYAKDLAPDVEVIEAENGQECVDKCKENLPDIIILDVNMPVMTGEECLQRLRADEDTKSVAVVMLTTESEKQLVVRLLQLGVQQFIIKPFEKQEFITKVGGVLAKMAKKGQTAEAKVATPEGKYALVIEDKENITRTIEAAAKGTHEAVICTDVGQALEHFKANAPDVVLVNMTMESLDGFELLVQLRKVPDRQAVRYVGMCLKTAKEVIARARGTGYIDILLKPFTAEDVQAVLTVKASHEVLIETEGDVAIARCQGNSFGALIPLITKAIEGAAEDGYMKVCIDLRNVPEGSLGDLSLWGGIAEKTTELGMRATYLSPSPHVIDKLKGLVDTQSLQVSLDQDEAISQLAA